MKHKYLSLFSFICTIVLTSCSLFNLSKEEVSKDFWTKNITNGGLFSGDNNFTIHRNVTFKNGDSSLGEVKFDKGKLSIENDDEEIQYFEIIDDTFAYQYFLEDNEYVKIKKYLSNALEEILNYTILENYKYDTFSFDKENLVYIANDYTINGNLFSTITFSFLDNKVVSFTATCDDFKVNLTADSYGTTAINLPQASIVSDENPYLNKKYHISDFAVENETYSEFLNNYFYDSDLYITNYGVEIIKEHSKYSVDAFPGNISSNYNRREKSFTINFTSHYGYGRDYDYDSLNKDYSIIEKVDFIDNNLYFVFKIYDEENKDDYILINGTGRATFVENNDQGYEYKFPGIEYRKSFEGKKINVVSKSDDPLFNNAYLIISPNSQYFEMHLADNIVFAGSANFEQNDDTKFYLEFLVIFKGSSDSKEFYHDSIIISEENNLESQIYYKEICYEFYLELTDENINLMYEDVLINRHIVSEERWNDLLNNHYIPEIDFSLSYSKIYRNDSYLYVNLVKNDNKVKVEFNDNGIITKKYYEIGETETYEYVFDANTSLWHKYRSSFNFANYYEYFGYDISYNFNEYQQMDNNYFNEIITIYFNFSYVNSIWRSEGDNSISILFEYSGIFVNLPDLI